MNRVKMKMIQNYIIDKKGEKKQFKKLLQQHDGRSWKSKKMKQKIEVIPEE